MKPTWIVAGILSLAIAGGLAFAAAQNSEAPSMQTVQDSVSFTVDNMTCATCPISVKKAMMRVGGVKSVDIDFETKTAQVVFDPARTTPDAIGAASSDVGYPARETD